MNKESDSDADRFKQEMAVEPQSDSEKTDPSLALLSELDRIALLPLCRGIAVSLDALLFFQLIAPLANLWDSLSVAILAMLGFPLLITAYFVFLPRSPLKGTIGEFIMGVKNTPLRAGCRPLLYDVTAVTAWIIVFGNVIVISSLAVGIALHLPGALADAFRPIGLLVTALSVIACAYVPFLENGSQSVTDWILGRKVVRRAPPIRFLGLTKPPGGSA